MSFEVNKLKKLFIVRYHRNASSTVVYLIKCDFYLIHKLHTLIETHTKLIVKVGCTYYKQQV